MTKMLWIAVPAVFLLAVVATQLRTSAKSETEVRISQIIVKADATKPEDIERARRKIEDLHEQLKKGVAFKMLAMQNSEADGARRGGDLGWVGRGVLPKRLEDIAFALKPGQFSEITSDIGPETHIYRILYVEERRN
jgi:peptidyl-prolyl cis-trans isomerase SurA